MAVIDSEAPDSVHLSDFPTRTDSRADGAVESSVDLARRVVAVGRTARAASKLRTRQPLRTVRVKLPASASGQLADDPGVAAAMRDEILDELNARELELLSTDSGLVERTLFPLLPVIGPRHGAAVGRIMAAVRDGAWQVYDDGTAEAGGVRLAPDEFRLTARARAGHEISEEDDLLVALDTAIDDDLAAEGVAREVAHRLQGLRKAAGYEISDRIAVAISGDQQLLAQLEPHREWLAGEVLAPTLELAADALLDAPDRTEEVELDGGRLSLAVARAAAGSVG